MMTGAQDLEAIIMYNVIVLQMKFSQLSKRQLMTSCSSNRKSQHLYIARKQDIKELELSKLSIENCLKQNTGIQRWRKIV